MKAASQAWATVARPVNQGSTSAPAARKAPATTPVIPPVTSFIGIGGNLGDAQATVAQALHDIASLPHTALVLQSSLYRTEPVDSTGPDYINAVAEISTSLEPHALLAQLQALESRAGRARPYRNAPRTLDLDILLYDDQVLNTPTLTVPHPRMMQRAFVLVPLAEIAPKRVSAAELQAVHEQPICRLAAADNAKS